MTAPDVSDAEPFWRRKRLAEMTDVEWESLCDGCGRCCLIKLADERLVSYSLDVGCSLLDTTTCRCTDYPNRLVRDEGCIQLTAANISSLGWMPATCAYRLLNEGSDLEWWHPLVSGDPGTVRKAGIKVTGRAIDKAKAGRLEYHTVDWPFEMPTGNRRLAWKGAMFGGVNASVPTAFGSDGRLNIDLMAAHCFGLFGRGCHGMTILDKAGEVASLAIDERVAVLEGLASRGVPASKILAGIGPASVADSAKIATRAAELGIRGILLTAPASGKMLARDIVPEPMRSFIRQVPAGLAVYLSLAVSHHSTAACLGALDALMIEVPGRLTGIRDEAPGCKVGLAAVEHFRGTRFEVYAGDETMLTEMTEHGGAGLISPGPNLFGRLCRQVIESGETEAAIVRQNALDQACKILRSRPMIPSLKALIAQQSGQPDWDRMRLPLRPLGPVDRTVLFRAADSIELARAQVAKPARSPTAS